LSRYLYDPEEVDEDDVRQVRPGGIVRVRRPQDLTAITCCTTSSISGAWISVKAYSPPSSRYADHLKCVYCGTVTKTKAADPIPKKCWACGGPRRHE
jgi:hypothetical protein